jgi:Flp pilus assembly pilin Flp
MFIRRNARHPAMPPRHGRQRGSALIEYTVVVLLLVTVLLANPNVIRQLADALRDAYTSFVYALSISWI